MRFLVKAAIPVASGNAVIKTGKLGETVQAILADLKPEAVYFTADGGMRTVYLVVDISDPAQLPKMAEPFFLAFSANVEFHLIMLGEDLMKAEPAIEQAVKKYS